MCLWVYVYVLMCVCSCVHVCMLVCLCVYIHVFEKLNLGSCLESHLAIFNKQCQQNPCAYIHGHINECSWQRQHWFWWQTWRNNVAVRHQVKEQVHGDGHKGPSAVLSDYLYEKSVNTLRCTQVIHSQTILCILQLSRSANTVPYISLTDLRIVECLL